MPRLPLRATVLAAACAVLAGCGGESDEEQVRSAVADFGEATAKRDYQRLCDELLSERLVERTRQALPCEQAFRVGLEGVQSPKLTVRAVEVDGDTANARVRSEAQGQEPSNDVIRLVREGGGWRIDALAEPDRRGPIPGP
jgi:ketosteroid isomerase-like protein